LHKERKSFIAILLTLTPNPSPIKGEGCLFLILLSLFAPLSPLVGERGWGIEGECKKPTLVRVGGLGDVAP